MAHVADVSTWTTDMDSLLSAVNGFLLHEAKLLDDWQLIEWAELFTDDGEYLVPSTDLPQGTPEESLFLIYDDRHRLTERAKRLLKRTAHVEYPRSRTLHTISNVSVTGQQGERIEAECGFVVYRSRDDHLDIFPGRSQYEFRRQQDGTLRIRRKRSVLILEVLRPHNKLSIII